MAEIELRCKIGAFKVPQVNTRVWLTARAPDGLPVRFPNFGRCWVDRSWS